MNIERVILHVDMDAFYASVEQRDHPQWRGKPVIVGGTSGRGVVAAASYEVRRFGVRSAMPIRRALALCPDAICIRPRMAHYAAVSAEIFAVFREFTPLVEGLSLDEAFLDVTASRSLLGDAETIAREVKRQIFERTQLRASVGVAPNKLVAKIASDLDKPDGLTIVTVDRLKTVLDPLPVRRLPGLGRLAGERVVAAGIQTIGELRQAPDSTLQRLFGRHAPRWRERAAGIDERPVIAEHDDRSVSNERTFATDLTSSVEMHAELSALADRVAARLRAKGRVAACIGIKIRKHDFSTITRQTMVTPPTAENRTIVTTARRLLDMWLTENPRARLRLLGVSSSELSTPRQADLFAATEAASGSRLDTTLDAIRERFGNSAVSRASRLRSTD